MWRQAQRSCKFRDVYGVSGQVIRDVDSFTGVRFEDAQVNDGMLEKRLLVAFALELSARLQKVLVWKRKSRQGDVRPDQPPEADEAQPESPKRTLWEPRQPAYA